MKQVFEAVRGKPHYGAFEGFLIVNRRDDNHVEFEMRTHGDLRGRQSEFILTKEEAVALAKALLDTPA